jgi:hypothetical protein
MQPDNPMAWPKQTDQDRINRYTHNDLLYNADHFAAFSIKAEKDFSLRYQKLRYIVANFSGIVSRTMADMLFGDNLTVDVKDKNGQGFIDSLIETNDFFTQLWESAVCNSRRGDAVFKLRVGKRHPRDEQSTIIIEETTPAIYFPVFERNMTRFVPKQEVIAEVFKADGVTILHKEIHEPGFIFNEVYTYDETKKAIIAKLNPAQYGFKEEEPTGIKRPLVVHTPNIRDGNGYFGTSDYNDLETLFFALNNRITKMDNILDKHSDPILAVPPGVLDEGGKIRKEALGMFEVDNEQAGFNKPEYIVWNANLEAAEKQVDKLVDMLYMFSEVSPATTGMEREGVAESGRALKFRMISTIRKRNRKLRHYDMAIKNILLIAQELALEHGIKIEDSSPTTAERPQLKWNDRIINDEVEAVEIATSRIDNGTWSRADAISDLDRLSPEDAAKKVLEIDKENTAALPAPVESGLNGSGTGKPGPSDPNANSNPAGK